MEVLLALEPFCQVPERFVPITTPALQPGTFGRLLASSILSAEQPTRKREVREVRNDRARGKGEASRFRQRDGTCCSGSARSRVGRRLPLRIAPRRNWEAEKFEQPISLTFPALTASSRTAMVSPIGVWGSGRWIWYKSIRSVAKRRNSPPTLDGHTPDWHRLCPFRHRPGLRTW